MKVRVSDVSFLIGLALVFGPFLLGMSLSIWIYVCAVVGLVLMAIPGYGSLMKISGQSDTGEELLQGLWMWIKKRLKQVRKIV